MTYGRNNEPSAMIGGLRSATMTFASHEVNILARQRKETEVVK
jgi:hypothetical protein